MQTQFQSTHPCGVRPADARTMYLEFIVSIHAPLRGATLVVWCRADCGWCFNPRTPAGCDSGCGRRAWICSGFNPRTPAGCDDGTLFNHAGRPTFQSTHPCGVRPPPHVTFCHLILVSIHAPLRGATCPFSSWRREEGVSIHAPLRGATGGNAAG